MNRLENPTDQGDPELSAEVDLYRVLKLLLQEKEMKTFFSQWVALV
jgi:hypothetical protein